MEKRFLFFYFIGLGVFLLIGFLIAMANVGEGDYYRNSQVYNHLPPLNQPMQVAQSPQDNLPAPIQHYQQSVELANQNTEQNALAINTQGGNQTTSTINILNLYNNDGSLNLFFVVFWVMVFFWFIRKKKIW